MCDRGMFDFSVTSPDGEQLTSLEGIRDRLQQSQRTTHARANARAQPQRSSAASGPGKGGASTSNREVSSSAKAGAAEAATAAKASGKQAAKPKATQAATEERVVEDEDEAAEEAEEEGEAGGSPGGLAHSMGGTKGKARAQARAQARPHSLKRVRAPVPDSSRQRQRVGTPTNTQGSTAGRQRVSSRQRFSPLSFWAGERVVYEQAEGGSGARVAGVIRMTEVK